MARVIDLRGAPLLLPAYVALRNRWCAMLLTEAVTEEGTRGWLATADVGVRCLEEQGRLVGAAVLYRARGGEIAVFVAEPGRGSGAALIADVVALARRQGLRSVVARVRADNPPGLAVFRKAGFAETGRRAESHGGVLIECVSFLKRLEPPPRGPRAARLGILQPGYLPWLGFFEQLARVDLFVIYDDVQYDSGGWRNRNRVKTASGVRWLTVPVHVAHRDAGRVMDVRIDNRRDWGRKHLLTLTQSYARAPHLARYAGVFEETYARRWEWLVDLDLHLIGALAEALGIDPGRLRRSSELGVEGGREERLLRICERFGADTFYEGAAGRAYLDEQRFAEAGVRVEFQDYRHPVYPQLHGPFVSHLSVVDLLFNCGEESRAYLLGEKGEVTAS